MHILIVEDNTLVASGIQTGLVFENYKEVDKAIILKYEKL